MPNESKTDPGDKDRVPGPASEEADPTIHRADMSLEATIAAASRNLKAAHPERIGSYRILRLLGEGGMGAVYEAEQREPRRSVALKVIRGGFLSPESLRLFSREAQVLARLSHPGIAVIHEFGRTDDGHPFFAMELVVGQTLSSFLERRPPAHSSHSELHLRLELFRKINDAVVYAHQRGVIHRDLKPANIMVVGTASPGAPPADLGIKVLDFGLGRIIGTDSPAETIATGMGSIQGTLAYMAPEQARGDIAATDVRADVYALGMILYELLSGQRPYEVSDLSLLDAVRTICESPARPFSRLIAGPSKLDRDLEIIALKAIEKEPKDRYPSSSALATDIDNYLAHLPIVARPPSALYRLRKAARRHRLAFSFVATLAVMLVAFAATMAFQAARIAREARRAEAVKTALIDVISASDPYEVDTAAESDTRPRADTMTARELLDRGERRIGRSLREEPLIEAELLATLGSVYENLGASDRAIALQERGLELRRTATGNDSLDTGDSLFRLASARFEHGELDEAERLLQRVLTVRRRHYAADAPAIVATLIMLGNVHQQRGEVDEGGRWYSEAVERAARSGEDSLDLSIARMNLGVIRAKDGRRDEAERLYRQALATRERLLGPRHPYIATTLGNLGLLLRDLGRNTEAEPLLARALAIREATLPAGHPQVSIAMNNLAEVYRTSGRLDEAEGLYSRGLVTLRAAKGDESPIVGTFLFNLADIKLQRGRAAEAEPLFRESLTLSRAQRAPDPAEVGETLGLLAEAVAKQGRLNEAERLFVDAVSELETAGPQAGELLARTVEARRQARDRKE